MSKVTKEKDQDLLLPGLCAVKKKYGEANGLISYLNKQSSERDSWILETLWSEKNSVKMWEYVIKFQVKSSYDGLTEIGHYTNKKGKTSLAHFNGMTYVKAAQKDDRPLPCKKWSVPCKENWFINLRGEFKKKE